MTPDLKRWLATLEARTSLARPVRDMSDADLAAAVGLGDNPSDEQLRQVLEQSQRPELNTERQSE